VQFKTLLTYILCIVGCTLLFTASWWTLLSLDNFNPFFLYG